MNEGGKMRIQFCICYSDVFCYQKALSCIDNLVLPEGVEVFISAVSEAENIAEAYNAVTDYDEFDYRVYMYENVYIVNQSFIADVIEVFCQDDTIGMLGVLGEKKEKSDQKYGKWNVGCIDICNEYRTTRINYNCDSYYSEVDILNGVILVTKLNFKWKSLANDKNGYFDLVQSEQVREMGYKLVVPKQDTVWCLYEFGKSEYERMDIYTSDIGSRYVLPQNANEEKLVSVIIPVYNCEKYIGETLQSVVNQKYPNLQILVVDDCSTDDSWRIINEYASKDRRIEPIRLEKNSHLCVASNVAFGLSRGKYIALLGHDDLWDINKIDNQVKFLELFGEYSVCMSSCRVINSQGEDVTDFDEETRVYRDLFAQPNRSRSQWIDRLYYKSNALCAPSAMLRRDCVGGQLYNVGLLQLQDYYLWLLMLLKGNIYVMQEQLTKYRYHFGDNTNLSAMDEKKLNRMYNESVYIKKAFLERIDDAAFVDLFGKHLVKSGELSHLDIICEKALILKEIENKYFIDKFIEIFEDAETSEVFEKEYGIRPMDFYGMMTRIYV